MSWGCHTSTWISVSIDSSNGLLPNGTKPLTHSSHDKMAAISQMTFSNAFSWMKMCEFRLTFHWSLFLRVKLTKFHHWFRWGLVHICVAQPQWVKTTYVDLSSWGSVAFTWGQFHMNQSKYQSLRGVSKSYNQNCYHICQEPMSLNIRSMG